MGTMNETPTKADLVIIGAGCDRPGRRLSRRQGRALVVVLDRGRIGGGASRGNAGLLVPSSFAPLCEPGVIGQALAELVQAGRLFQPQAPLRSGSAPVASPIRPIDPEGLVPPGRGGAQST